eukprot:COSAG04_NODE_32067_length_253_cov_0.675325_1_plen_54_part_00
MQKSLPPASVLDHTQRRQGTLSLLTYIAVGGKAAGVATPNQCLALEARTSAPA